MNRIVIFTLIFYCQILIAFSQNCGIPIESYVEALNLVEQDRAELRRKSDQLIANQLIFQAGLDSTLASIRSKISSLKATIAEKAQTYTDRINSLGQEILNYKESKGIKHYIVKDAIIYQNIFDALTNNVISKLGNPVGWDEITYKDSPWNGRKIMNIGVNVQTDGNGLKVNVPVGYDLLWLRALNERTMVFRVKSLEYADDIVEKYDCFRRSLNELSPDGASTDSYSIEHKWCPIPLHFTGSYVVYSDANTDGCISGIAFSKNLWHMAKNGALGYAWHINGGTGIEWHMENWQGEALARIVPGIVSEFFVPVIPSGKDKLLYLVEHNNDWDGLMHGSILVNNVQVERLRTTYYNAFSIHINSKIYNRYAAVRVPWDIIPENSKFLKVKIDMTMCDNWIYVREIGTHDYIE